MKPTGIYYLSITSGIVSSKIYDKRDDFNFEIIVNWPFLDGDVPRSLPMVYIFLSLFVLQACVLMLMTSTTETYLFYLLSYQTKFKDIIKFEKHFLNSTTDTQS